MRVLWDRRRAGDRGGRGWGLFFDDLRGGIRGPRASDDPSASTTREVFRVCGAHSLPEIIRPNEGAGAFVAVRAPSVSDQKQ